MWVEGEITRRTAGQGHFLLISPEPVAIFRGFVSEPGKIVAGFVASGGGDVLYLAGPGGVTASTPCAGTGSVGLTLKVDQ